ncbi:MAG: glycosyltransferase family 2 protein [Oscillospiraceae bacterium]|nr:glycosyltransferase family 2 protein [Oscillospiraceae bacterium]
MSEERFGVFILSHGRADRVYTYKTLRSQGYTGDIRILLDNEDESEEEYRKAFGDQVLVFDKEEWRLKTDVMDTFGRRNVVVFARNAVFEIAKQAGYKYICVLDDDYKAFEHRWAEDGKLKVFKPKRLDLVFEAAVRFLKTSGAKCYAFAQAGDLIGGASNQRFHDRVMRKIMNTYFFDVDKPVVFSGTLDEDMVASLRCGLSGDLILTSVDMTIQQVKTQANKGGLTEAYLDMGTYTKSFYAVMMNPSICKIAMMGDKHMRIHHRVAVNGMAPMIISGRYQKKRQNLKTG